MDVAEVAAELYSLPPGEFTAARNRHATAARTAGDRDLAAAIGKLRRPTRGAWLVNAAVRASPELAEELLRLGEEMRRAQQRLAGNELRRLSPRRAELVQELTRAARQAAGGAGEAVTAEMERELQSTVEAALADPAAAEAVRAGQLAAPLSYSGLGSVDGELDWAPAPPRPARAAAAPERAPAPAAARPTRTKKAPESGAAGAPSRRGAGRDGGPTDRRRAKLERARAAVVEAQAEADRARSAAEEAAGEAKAALEERSRHERRTADLEEELASLRAAAGEVGRVVAERTREQSATRRVLRLAEERLTRARRELQRAEGG